MGAVTRRSTPGGVLLIIQKRLAPFRQSFFRELAATGAWQIVVTYGAHDSVTPSPDPGFHPVEVPTRRLFGGRLLYQPGLQAIIRSMRVTAIVAEARVGMLSNLLVLRASRRAGIPFIWWTSAYEPPADPVWRRPIPGWRLKLLAAADGIIAYGRGAKRSLVAMGIDPATVWIAPNTVDVEDWGLLVSQERRARVRSRYGVADDDVVVLFVGKMTAEKRIDLLLEAVREFEEDNPRVWCWLVGDGVHRAQLEESEDGRRNRVVFLGAVWDRESLGELFNGGDVFVLPGTGGLAINQAMAFGLPVIVSKADGTEQDLVVDGETGFIFRQGDVTSLICALKRITGSVEERRRIGLSARRHALENFSLPRTAEAFVDAVTDIQNVVNQRLRPKSGRFSQA
jgi:glycosyltransferase involved in cell wall biosynthesis